MEKFVVSARKYRPSTFDSVVGQQSITDTLKNAIKTGHLAQAFLFCGSRGVGKTTCARILAKTINCSNRKDNIEACNECDSCKAFNEGTSLNILEMDAASNNSVDNIRELTDQVRFAPQVGDYKVYIIDEVHMLSQAAFNAFLKTLEEPPAHAIFILATTEKHKIIPTILSRCQIFDFNRIGVEDISSHLEYIAKEEDIKAEEEALHIIAQKADGALRDALSMFDQLVSFSGRELSYQDVITNLNILDYDYYFRCTDIIREGNIPGALLLFDEIRKRGFDGHLFINGLASHLRNLLVCQDEQTLELLEAAPSVKQRYRDQSVQLTPNFIMKALDICRECDYQYKSSKNQRLLVELSLMQLASINQATAQPAEKKKHEIRSHEVSGAQLHGKTEDEDEDVNSENRAEIRDQKSEKDVAEENDRTRTTDSDLESNSENSSEIPDQKSKNDVAKENDRTRTPDSDLESNSENRSEIQDQKSKKDVAEKTAPQKKEIVAEFEPDRTRSLSIHALTTEQKERDEAKEKEAFTSDDRKEFDQETFLKVWKELAKKIETEAWEGSSMLIAAMTSREPTLAEDHKIHLLVDNKSQAEELMLRRTDFHDFLRKKLSNGVIEVLVTVNKEPKLRKAYTDEEKFKEMAEKNPDVLKLRQQLDLDFL